MGAITASRADGMTIGQVSELTGVNIETIRYYEKIKVLPPPLRAANGRRVYGATERRILAFVRRSRELGFSLDEVRALLHLGGPEKASCREVRNVAAHHLDEIRSKIGDLRKLERLLATTIARCTGSAAPECPLLEILDIQRPKIPGNSNSSVSLPRKQGLPRSAKARSRRRAIKRDG